MNIVAIREPMECDYCHVAMQEKQATAAEPYRYTISGLKDVCLIGIAVRTCPKCKVSVPIIPRIAELHDVIARAIVKEPHFLRGDQIRFLRKAAALPARKFATILGITPQHLSRIENGHTLKLGKVADRMARIVTVKARDGEDYREVLLQVAEKLDAQCKTIPSDTTDCFELDPNSGWKSSA